MLIDRLKDINLLKKIFQQIYTGKDFEKRKFSRGYDDITIEDFHLNKELYLTELVKELNDNKYKLSPLKPIIIERLLKEKDRLICVPTIRDRIILKSVLNLIIKYHLTDLQNKVSYCGVPKSTFSKYEDIYNTLLAFIRISNKIKNGNFYYLKADISGFFDNVQKKDIYLKAIAPISDDSLDFIIRDIIYFKLSDHTKVVGNNRLNNPLSKIKGIPQGSSLSPLFSNIYLVEFDKFMYKNYGDNYIRYVDDFIVLNKSKEEIQECQLLSENYLRENGLELNSKTKPGDIREKSFVFLGFEFSKYGIKVSSEKRTEIKKNLVNDIFNRKYHEKQYSKYAKYGRKYNHIKNLQSRLDAISGYLSLGHEDDFLKQINRNIQEIVLGKSKSAKRKKPRRRNKNKIYFQGIKMVKSKLHRTRTGKMLPKQQEWKNYFK